jgi:hypothetical protein
MNIKVIPIDSRLQPEMAAAINSFINANCPADAADKAWAVYWQDGEAIKILGFASCNLGSRMADVPVYHIDKGTSRQEQWAALKAHELLFARVTGFVADTLGSGTQAFFHIAPEAQEQWKEFAKTVNGRNANRFVMEV